MSKASLIRAGTFLLRYVPRSWAQRVALTLADACWLLLKERRAILVKNLAYLVPDKSGPERRRMVRSTFRNLALATLDFLELPLLKKDDIIASVEIQGRENLDRALAKGKGVVLVTAHLGNWDFAGAYLAALGYPVHAVAENVAPQTYEIYERYRGSTGMRILSLNTGAVAAYRVLKRKGILVLLGDRAIRARGRAVEFCEGRRALPEGPAVLALKTGAPIVLGHFVLNPRGSPRRYLSVIQPELLRLQDAPADVGQLTQAVSQGLCEAIRRYPDQWFVFQPEWIEANG